MQRVLITGASSGLGRGLAEVYGASGAHVGLIARREDLLHEVGGAVVERGGRSSLYVADVTDTVAMERAVRDFAHDAGGLDVVIANAGVGEGRTTERFDARRVTEVLQVNVVGLTNTLLPAIPVMKRAGAGTLVGMASVAGYRALPGSLAYSASKGFVMTFMEGLALELHGTGVHAMSICPGFVRTPLTDENDFHMPFLIECDDAVARMKRAIDAQKTRFTFPLPMALAAQLLRVLPSSVLRRVAPRKS